MNVNDLKFRDSIPHCTNAVRARKAVTIILGRIEWNMYQKPQEFLEFGFWDMPDYDDADKEFMDSLSVAEKDLVDSWLRSVLRDKGWDISSEKLQIIPYDSSKNEKR